MGRRCMRCGCRRSSSSLRPCNGVRMCVEGVRKRTGLGKKKRKTKKKEKKKMRTHCKPIHRLHGTGSSMPAVSLWVEGRGRSRADHSPRAETMGGRGEGHARVMHAMWVEAVIVKTSRWRGNLIFWPGKRGGMRGWCLDVCREGAQTHRTGKKTKVKKTPKKIKRKMDSPVQTPTKTPTSTGLACVACV